MGIIVAKKREKGFTLASLQNHLRNPFKIIRLMLANMFVRRDTLRLKLRSLFGGEELEGQTGVMKKKKN